MADYLIVQEGEIMYYVQGVKNIRQAVAGKPFDEALVYRVIGGERKVTRTTETVEKITIT